MQPDRIFPDEYVPREQAASTHKKWEQANPNGDAPKWRAFRDKALAYKEGDAPVAAPDMATPHGDALVAAGKLHMSVIDLGADYATTPPPPPSGTGVLRDSFTDFYTYWGATASDNNGYIFQNRWKTNNLQTRFATQTPWTSTGGAAIFEVNDAAGRPGFRFVCNAEMDNDYPGVGSNKKVEIYESEVAGDNPYGTAMARGLGFTDEIAFYVYFPSSGNPSGFPGPNQNVFDRRNVFWQHSMDPSYLNFFGISRLGNTNRFFLSIMRNGSQGTELLGTTLGWEVQMNTFYHFRYIVKWANNNTGTFKWWVQRPSDPSEVQYADYTGVTYGASPNTEFGFYSAKVLSNEVIISDIRVTH